jgi:DNA processing protein
MATSTCAIATDNWFDWILLGRLPEVGPATYHKLIQYYGSPQAALAQAASNSQLLANAQTRRLLNDCRQARLHGGQHPLLSQVEQDLSWLRANSGYLICFNDPLYPPLLKTTPNPPPVLYVQGNPALLSLPQLALVGSRNPSPSGCQLAYDFACQLASQGLLITSGLALGIDSASHQGALAAPGKTIAVLGTGLDRIYPARHRTLAQTIAEQGALVSEFPLGTAPQASHFPRRNRIISGLSLGILVIEASVKSGSLITARYALEQGREVFAIPGNIANPLSRGCHALIKQGATLVETIADIQAELPSGLIQQHWQASYQQLQCQLTHQTLSADEQLLLSKVDFTPCSIDQLIERSGLAVAKLAASVVKLEMAGLIDKNPEGYCLRKSIQSEG